MRWFITVIASFKIKKFFIIEVKAGKSNSIPFDVHSYKTKKVLSKPGIIENILFY